eukprot:TRINITY_DN1786_c0_g1_i12.p2 TRINITY_DN1786_c0_g1~~TRINITY_DN1786_c0_g1_i12.p2  ORF type:complete len:254 (+),score=27.45 TRINITY_DN1786_c0_g1_i12:3017-3778(+)
MKYLNFKTVAIFMSLGLLAAGGCSDANVELVKNGCFDNYKEATIGTILQERFDDCKWTSTKESGRTIVTFTGKISKATHDLAMNNIPNGRSILLMIELIKAQNFTGIDSLDKAFKKKIASSDLPDMEEKLYKLRYGSKEYKEMNQRMNSKDEEFMIECYHELYWPSGANVELEWIIYPDGKTFELDKITNTSWNDFKLKWNLVLQVLFSRQLQQHTREHMEMQEHKQCIVFGTSVSAYKNVAVFPRQCRPFNA